MIPDIGERKMKRKIEIIAMLLGTALLVCGMSADTESNG